MLMSSLQYMLWLCASKTLDTEGYHEVSLKSGQYVVAEFKSLSIHYLLKVS